ncbi:MAG: F0F1 ATP synthase subunit gamma [Clostridiales bacterium]|jgi:F-type H+-transporting ATPase subunit gamma|nr:F0F1 ATP synthase subunit gamma [Clostridiales bacterium]
MASLNELKSRVASIKSTKQITRAMYLISASKSKKAKAQLESSKPFFDQIFVTLSEILRAASATMIESPFIELASAGTAGAQGGSGTAGAAGAAGARGSSGAAGTRDGVSAAAAAGGGADQADPARVAGKAGARDSSGAAGTAGARGGAAGGLPSLYLVLAGDKGMAGGYNHNIIDFLEEHVAREGSELLVAGFVGRNRIRQKGYSVDPGFTYPVMNPTLARSRDVADILIERFLSKRCRDVSIVYSTLESAMKQTPTMLRLLPLSPGQFSVRAERMEHIHAIRYVPSSRELFDHLTPHYVKGIVYDAFVDAFTSEQHARMIAMDGATKSAGELIDSLSARYNLARQALITQEINEIVSGIPGTGGG